MIDSKAILLNTALSLAWWDMTLWSSGCVVCGVGCFNITGWGLPEDAAFKMKKQQRWLAWKCATNKSAYRQEVWGPSTEAAYLILDIAYSFLVLQRLIKMQSCNIMVSDDSNPRIFFNPKFHMHKLHFLIYFCGEHITFSSYALTVVTSTLSGWKVLQTSHKSLLLYVLCIFYVVFTWAVVSTNSIIYFIRALTSD